MVEAEQVKSFTYLGSIVTIDGGALENVHSHIKKENGPSCICTQFGGIKIS
jgi:hypothetical protein